MTFDENSVSVDIVLLGNVPCHSSSTLYLQFNDCSSSSFSCITLQLFRFFPPEFFHMFLWSIFPLFKMLFICTSSNEFKQKMCSLLDSMILRIFYSLGGGLLQLAGSIQSPVWRVKCVQSQCKCNRTKSK